MDKIKTIADILRVYKSWPMQPEAFSYIQKGKVTTLSSSQFLDYAECMALGLHDIGIKKGDHLGIYAKSSPFWLIVSIAAQSIGAIIVPFMPRLSEQSFILQATDSSPRLLFVGDHEDWLYVWKNAGLFEATVSIDEGSEEKTTHDFYDLIRKGALLRAENPHLYEELKSHVVPDDVAAILYTSGTSGHSRGVMLTHGNLVAIIPHNYFNLCPADSYLSLLPLAHIFPLQIALVTLTHGVKQIYLHDLTRISEMCNEYHPTGMIVVPRILEKALEKMKERLETLEGWRKKLGVWALDLAFRPRSLVRMLIRPFADFFVYRKLRQGLGGKMRVIINGGASLNPSLQSAFNYMGFPIFQGWGLTEASTVTVNRFGNNKEGTVGKPYPGTVIKISTHGEVLVRGPTVMKGYYKNPVATAEAIDEKGWLHTGDIGSIDLRGRLKIIGRLSDSFKNSRGQYIIPSPIEEKLRSYPLIDYALITGENEPFVTALLFPNVAELDKLRGDMSLEEFLKSPMLKREVEQIIREVNTTLDEWERIRDYRFILEPPTLANGELTPTLKLRRQLVLGKHKGLISSLYQSAH